MISKTGKLLIYRRVDLIPQYKDMPMEEIDITMFFGEMTKTRTADFIIFVDDDSTARVFKSRYSNTGIILPMERN